jgi:hypothetical protein
MNTLKQGYSIEIEPASYVIDLLNVKLQSSKEFFRYGGYGRVGLILPSFDTFFSFMVPLYFDFCTAKSRSR